MTFFWSMIGGLYAGNCKPILKEMPDSEVNEEFRLDIQPLLTVICATIFKILTLKIELYKLGISYSLASRYFSFGKDERYYRIIAYAIHSKPLLSSN